MAIQKLASNNAKGIAFSNTGVSLLSRTQRNAYAEEQARKAKNNGSGIIYVAEKLGLGVVSAIEGVWDYAAGGVADLFGADRWAERQFANDWVNYSHADEWYNPSTGWKIAGDVFGGIGTSAPAIAMAFIPGPGWVGAAATAGTTFLSGAGNATKEAYKETGNLEYGYGALVGATEAGIELASAGIGTGTGRIVKAAASRNAAKQTAKQVTKTVSKTGAKQIAKKIGADFASEAIEEGLSEILTPQWQKVTYNPDAENASIEEIAYAALVGGLSGAMMTGSAMGIKSGINTVDNLISGRKSMKDGTVSEILKDGKAITDLEMAEDTGIEPNMSSKKIYENLMASLKKRGINTAEEAISLAEQGALNLNVKEQMYLGKLKKSNAIAAIYPEIERAFLSIVYDPKTSAERYSKLGMKYENGQKIKITEKEILEGIDQNLLEKARANTLTEEEAKAFAKNYRKALSENSVLATVAAAEATGRIMVNSKRISDSLMKDQNLANGVDIYRFIKTASPKRKQAVAEAFGIENWDALTNAELAEKITEFRENGGTTKIAKQMQRIREAEAHRADGAMPMPQAFKQDIEDGFYKFKDTDSDIGVFKEGDEYFLYNYETKDVSKPLTKDDVNAYISRNREAPIEAKIVNTVTKKDENISKTESKVKKGEVYFEDITESNLNDRQKQSIKALRFLSNALGIDIYVFESSTNAEGKRIGENGWYDPSDHSIHIDLYAGVEAEALMLYTASHELTHHIKNVLPEKFNILASAIKEEYIKAYGEETFNKLLSDKKAFLTEKGRITKDMSKEQVKALVYEEVIADCCETMLLDSDALDALSKNLYVKDKTLWQKIKDFLSEFFARIKSEYKNVNPDSEEGLRFRDLGRTSEKIQKIWSDAIVEASKIDTIEVDSASKSVAPVMASERTWTKSEYVTNRARMAKKIADALGVTEAKAKKYIDDINSIAKMIANDRARLDYEASSFGSAFVSNVEYGGSFDYTTLCKKRRIYTGTFTEIQKRLNDVALTPEDILKIRNLMIEEGIEATCGLCYVEGSRANMGKFAKEFIKLYKRDNPLAWIPNMADVNTPDGVEKMRINHPEVYEQYEYFWNHYGKLKDSDPALFASQQKPKLYEARKEYKGEILEHFKDETAIEKKNRNGGIRMQSFSDFEIVHLIDTMQVIMDMSTVGLAGQAYTKVPEFAKAFGNTGLKINLSLIAKGVDADGNLIFDDREGMPHETAFELRDRYSNNVGTIIVTFTDEQLLAAMADPRIDFIIPFHRSQWKKGQYGAMGLPKGTKDYTYMQNEKLIKKTYHEYRGRMVLDKASNYMPNEYWDFSKSGKENAEAYLKMCAENNKRPKFYKLLDYDGKGMYSLKADGSTDGYWKLLIDFKMYDNNGVGSPQEAVTPTFNMDEAKTMLDEYQGGHAKYPVASSVVDKFVDEYNKSNKTKYSDRASAKSGFDKVHFINGVTQEVIDNYVEAAYLNQNSEDHKEYAEPTSRLIADVSSEIDISEYSHALRDNDIRHIKKSHGEETNEKYPVTQNDLTKIPYIVEYYDKVFVKTNANGDPGIVYVKVGKDNIIYYVEAVTQEYHNKKLLVNKQMIKAGIDYIPKLRGLEAAINKKESSSQYLADLQTIRKAYVQDVKENYSTNKIPQYEANVNRESEIDKKYFAALKSGDMETAQRMVDEAALEWGVETDNKGKPLHLYHGTSMFGFTSIDVEDASDDSISFFATNNLDVAQGYMPWYEDDASDKYHTEVRRIGKLDKSKMQGLTRTSSVEKILSEAKKLFPEYESARVATDEEILGDLNEYWLPEAISAAEKLRSKEISIASTKVRQEIKAMCDAVIDASEKNTYSAWKEVAKQYKKFESIDIPYDANDMSPILLHSHILGGIQQVYNRAKTTVIKTDDGLTSTAGIVDRYNTTLGGEALGIYDLYTRQNNQLVIQGFGSVWNNLPLGEHEDAYRNWLGKDATEGSIKASTRDIAMFAKSKGYRSVLFRDIYDAGAYGSRTDLSDVYAFFYPNEDVKSADPVTYDDNGNVIPLSERFNSGNNDIRYSDRASKKASYAPDFEIASGSIEMLERPSYKERIEASLKSAKSGFVPGVIATEIQFTNVQAGVEHAGKVLGVKNIEALVQRARASRAEAQEMLGGGQWWIAPDATKNQAVRMGDGLQPILSEVSAKREGETKEDATERYSAFQYYLAHKHNVDRMSLEQKSLDENKADVERYKELEKELLVLSKKIKANKASKETLKGKYNKASKAERARLKAEISSDTLVFNVKSKAFTELKKKIDNFVPDENKPVLRKELEDGSFEAITATESNDIVKLYEKKYPEFKGVSEKLYKFLNNLLKIQADSGLITQELYEELIKKYPHYVPTYRVEHKLGTAPIRGKGNIEVTQTVKKATGSLETLEDFELSISRLVQKAISASNVNILGNALVNAAEANNNTTYIKEVSRDKADNLLENEELEQPKNNQISIYRNGERITYAVTHEVFLGFDSFNTKDESYILPVRAMAKATSVFKTLVTSANPIFLVRNFVRDLQDAGINTKYGWQFAKNYFKAIKHLASNSELAQLYRAAGGFNASIFDYVDGFVGKQSKMGFTNSVNKTKWLLNKIENANMFIEQLPRFAEFICAIESGKSVDQAILDAADVTTNFGRSGKLTKTLNNTVIPFLNPAVQGLSKIYRNIKTATKSWKAAAALIVKCIILGISPMVLNNLLYNDDDDYKEIKDTDKENNYLFRVGDTWLKVPKGRVVSVLAGAANRTGKAISGEDPDIKGYLKNVVSQVTPVENITRPIWQPIFDAKNNKTWYGGEIEGRQFENVRPSQRYDESTSEIAKWLGEKFNYSPKKIHYVLDQYSGVIGDFVLPATTQKAQKSFVVSAFVFDPVTNNKLSDDFYKLYEEAKYKKSEGDETAKYQLKHLNEVKSAISDMYDEISKIQQSDLSNAEKLQQTRVIRVLINNAYKTARDDYALYTEAIELTAGHFDESTSNGVSMRYAEINRQVYGAEKALETYSSKIYEKMKYLNLSGIDYETLYAYYFGTKDIENDLDKKGEVISGSKRKKTVEVINKLKTTREQKLLLICASGYAIKDGDIRGLKADTAKKLLLKYILSLKNTTKEQKEELARICGFEVKNGKIILK